MTSQTIIRNPAPQVKDAISGVSASHGADVIGVVWYDEGSAGGLAEFDSSVDKRRSPSREPLKAHGEGDLICQITAA